MQACLPVLIVAGTVVYGPFFSDYVIPKLGAVYLLVPLMVAGWVLGMVAQRRVQLQRDRLYLPAAAFLLLGLVSLAVAVNRAQGLEALLLQGWLLVLYVVGVHHLQERDAAAAVVWTVVGVAFVVTGLGLLQSAGIHLIPLPKAYGDLPVSTLGNQNYVAHYLDLVIPLTAALVVARRRPWERVALAVVLVCACSHLVLTSTRGGWIGVACGLLLLSLWGRGRGRWRPVLVVAVVVAALLSPVAPVVLARIHVGDATLYDRLDRVAQQTVARARSVFARGDFSISQRRIVWSDTIDLIADHPWLGVGYGNYELILPAHRSIGRHREWQALMGSRTDVAYQAHNEYLEVLAETGPLGLAAFLWLVGALLWGGYRRLAHAADREQRLLIAGCLAGLVAALVHALFSFPLQDPAPAIHFWLLGALMMACPAAAPAPDAAQPWRVDRPLGRWPASALAAGAAILLAAGAWLGVGLVVADLHYFDGQRKLQIGQPNRAVLAFERAVAWRGHDFRYYHMLGLANLQAGRRVEAEQALRQSVALHPNNAVALRLWGRALYQLGRGSEAVAALRRVVQLAPLNPESYELLALALREQGQHAEAVEVWQQALAFAPEDAGLLNSLAVEYMQTGETEYALGVLERAAQLHPQDAQIQGNLGSACLAQGRAADGEQALLRAVALDPGAAQWRLTLAQLYAGRGAVQQAREQLQAVLRGEPGNLTARQLLQGLPGEERR